MYFLIGKVVCFFLRHNGNTSLPLTFIFTKERATKPSLLRASQEYTPLSSFTTSVIASLLFLSSNRVSIFALSGGESPSFFQVTFIVSSLTLQVNVRLSPAVSAGYWSGTTWAEAFPKLRNRQLIKILVHIRHPHRQLQFSVRGHVIVTVSVIVIVIKLTVNTQCCGGTSCICFMFRFTPVSIQIVRFNMSSRIKRLEWTTEFAIS